MTASAQYLVGVSCNDQAISPRISFDSRLSHYCCDSDRHLHRVWIGSASLSSTLPQFPSHPRTRVHHSNVTTLLERNIEVANQTLYSFDTDLVGRNNDAIGSLVGDEVASSSASPSPAVTSRVF